eukprot:COSAG01_NODE_18919_length_1043_cov_2.397246_1_plen_267_part_01
MFRCACASKEGGSRRPAIRTQEDPTTASGSRQTSDSKMLATVTVIRAFATTIDGDLGLTVGETIVVTKANPNKQWWRGYREGDRSAKGIFPKMCVEIEGGGAGGTEVAATAVVVAPPQGPGPGASPAPVELEAVSLQKGNDAEGYDGAAAAHTPLLHEGGSRRPAIRTQVPEGVPLQRGAVEAQHEPMQQPEPEAAALPTAVEYARYGIAVEALEAFPREHTERGALTADSTTSDACHALVKPATVPSGWVDEPEPLTVDEHGNDIR